MPPSFLGRDAQSVVAFRDHANLPVAFQIRLLDLRQVPHAIEPQQFRNVILAEMRPFERLKISLSVADKGNGAPFRKAGDDLRMRRDGGHPDIESHHKTSGHKRREQRRIARQGAAQARPQNDGQNDVLRRQVREGPTWCYPVKQNGVDKDDRRADAHLPPGDVRCVLPDQVVECLHGRGSLFSLRSKAPSNLRRAPVETPGRNAGPTHQKDTSLVELPALHCRHVDYNNTHVGGGPDHACVNGPQASST